MYNLLKKLTAIPSITGRERKLGEYILSEIKDYVDDAYFDTMGNLIAFKKGSAENAKKLMFAAHMDEIGMIVTHIDNKGYLRIAPIGGVNFASIAYSNALFENGVIGVLLPEAKVDANDWKHDKMYIDIGATDKKDAEKKIKIGDVAIYAPMVKRLMHRRVTGHAFDDKIGCAVMIKAIQQAKVVVNDTYYVFTVQEEVGCRGSKTAAFAIQPDWAVAFDVTGTGDMINATPMEVSLGKGAAIKIKDASVICDTRVVDLLTDIAKENDIKYQYEILTHGGTDTSSMQMTASGALAGCVSIPTRYIHTGVEMIDLADCDACVDLTVKLLAYNLNN